MDQYLLGWSDVWDQWLSDAKNSAIRITAKHKSFCEGLTFDGQRVHCYVSGKLKHETWTGSELPSVGDWCIVGEQFKDNSNSEGVIIEHVLPRRSHITRMGAGPIVDTQVLAANVDIMFAVTSANQDFSIRRMRRYLLLAEQGGVTPIVVLSKFDLADEDGLAMMDELYQAFPSVRVVTTSMFDPNGSAIIKSILLPGMTGVFVGSSGVGKSTLVNALLSVEAQKTSDVRETDDMGRHTTSTAGLFFVDGCGMIIDTPGLREVSVYAGDEALDRLMPTVQELAQECQFGDCTHSVEPGCAILKALESGNLDEDEYDSYFQLKRELAYSNRKIDKRAAAEQRKLMKQRTMNMRQRVKHGIR